MTLSYTPRFHLAVPDFLSEPWHAEFAAAMESIDQALFTAIVAQETDIWFNSRVYAIGDIIIDPTTGTLYAAAVSHTSSPTGTFADELALHPDFWTSFAVTAASQSEAELGTDNAKYMTPLRVAQAIIAQSPTPGIATTVQAQEATNNTEIMTPVRVKEGVTARLSSQPQAIAGTDNFTLMTPLRVKQQVQATGVSGGDAVGFSAHKNGVNQTGIASGVSTKITFGTELYDLGSFYDTTNSRWTPPSGQIHIASVVNIGGATVGGNLVLELRKNGNVFRQGVTVVGSATGEYVSVEVDDFANGTDFYEIFVNCPSATTLTAGGLATNTYFMGHFLGQVGIVTLGLAQVGFRAHKNGTSQNIPSAAYTKVTFAVEDYDQGSRFDLAQNRWVPPVGLVHIDTAVWFSAGATGPYALAAIFKNGVMLKQGVVAIANATPGSQVSVDDLANGTDYYELFVNVSSGSVAILDGSAINTWFSGHALVGIQGAVGPQGPMGADGAITAPAINCGRLRLVSATQLSFTPYNGDRIKINGVLQQIPAAGILGLTNTGAFVNGASGQPLAANTLYYVYAFMNAGAVTADFSTTNHTSSTTAGNVGTEIKIGDDTRTLIGMVRTSGTGGVQFADSQQNRLVLSWFNRQRKGLRSGGISATVGAAWTELSAADRCNFLLWADDFLFMGAWGWANSVSVDDTFYQGNAIDSAVNPYAYVANTQHAGWAANGSLTDAALLSEGFHFMTAIAHGGGDNVNVFRVLNGVITG